MAEQKILPQDYFPELTRVLAEFLEEKLPLYAGPTWWQNMVIRHLTEHQKDMIRRRNLRSMNDLDLSCLIRIMQRTYFDLSQMQDLLMDGRAYFFELAQVRNRAAHSSGQEPSVEDRYRDLDTMKRALLALKLEGPLLDSIADGLSEVRKELAPEKIIQIEKIREVRVESASLSPIPEGTPKVDFGINGALYGPLDLREEEATSTNGETQLAEVSVYRYRCDSAVDLEIGFYLFPDLENPGMIVTTNRFNSPQEWDSIVGRLRQGVLGLKEDQESFGIQVRMAKPKGDNPKWPTRHMTSEVELNKVCGFDVPKLLRNYGVISIGTRQALLGDKSKTRNQLYMRVPADDPTAAVLIYTVSTILPFRKFLMEA
jgi:hypothetical protein